MANNHLINDEGMIDDLHHAMENIMSILDYVEKNPNIIPYTASMLWSALTDIGWAKQHIVDEKIHAD